MSNRIGPAIETLATANAMHFHSLEVRMVELQIAADMLAMEMTQARNQMNLDYAAYQAEGRAEEYVRLQAAARNIRTEF